MNVGQLKEALAAVPDHWPVVVEDSQPGSGGAAETVYLQTLDAVRGSFPTLGNQVEIRIATPWEGR